MREFSQLARAMGAATRAKTRPIASGALKTSKTICWMEAMYAVSPPKIAANAKV
jgi:hypothetical protein